MNQESGGHARLNFMMVLGTVPAERNLEKKAHYLATLKKYYSAVSFERFNASPPL